MQRAIRAKHLRFLRDQTQHEDRGPLSGTRKERSPAPGSTPSSEVARGGQQIERSVGAASVLPPIALPARNKDRERAKEGGVTARDQQNKRLKSEAIEALNLRRLMDSGKLTQEQYAERLEWTSSAEQPLPHSTKLPSAAEILRSLTAARAGNKID